MGTLDDNELTFIVPINNVTNAGVLYYCLLIYQILIVIIVTTIGGLSFAAYLLVVQHACYQLNVIMYVFNRKIKFVCESIAIT